MTDSESVGNSDKIAGGFLSPRATACLWLRVVMHSKMWSKATRA